MAPIFWHPSALWLHFVLATLIVRLHCAKVHGIVKEAALEYFWCQSCRTLNSSFPNVVLWQISEADLLLGWTFVDIQPGGILIINRIYGWYPLLRCFHQALELIAQIKIHIYGFCYLCDPSPLWVNMCCENSLRNECGYLAISGYLQGQRKVRLLGKALSLGLEYYSSLSGIIGWKSILRHAVLAPEAHLFCY